MGRRSLSLPPGQIFTPPALAARLADAALDALGSVTGPVRAVEPAAGEGALLAAISVAALRRGLSLDLCAAELDPALVPALRRRFPDAAVAHADALSLARGDAPPGPMAAVFGAEAAETLTGRAARLRETGWADVVLANPPYLRETGNRATFRALRDWNDGAWRGLYRKDADLHHFFWALAMRWLRPGGVLAFLTPAYFLESESAAPLRARLASDGHVLGIYRAGADALFPDAGVEAAITVWRKGAPAGETEVWNAELRPRHRVRLPTDGSPWWLSMSEGVRSLTSFPRLASLYDVREGVSAGSNRVRSRDVSLVDAPSGAGILLLSPEEAAALASEPESARYLRRRHGTQAAQDAWIVYVRDGERPHLDRGGAPRSLLDEHLVRFRPILERRAEIRRNARRSWYALAWPRPELFAEGAIVTPKWAPAPAFEPMREDRVPMTDFRVLVPRSPAIAAARDSVLSWLHSDEVAPWFAHRMKRKGSMIEWYGQGLANIPVRLPPGCQVPDVA